MLRSYLPKGHPLKPQELGSEPTPAEFVDNLVRVFRLVRDAMADHATCWVNIGDTYASGVCGGGSPLDARTDGKSNKRNPTRENVREQRQGSAGMAGIPAGNLCLIPQRLAIALQEDKWLVRSVVCWCLSPSTRVYARTATTEGPATLHDLIRLDPATVQLWNGRKWTQVRGFSKTRSDEPIRLTLRSGERIGTTPNHQWPLADGRVVRADKLAVGDVLSTCILPESRAMEGYGIDPDLAWLAGLYLAEGFIDDDAIRISGNAKETERHDLVANIAQKYGGSSVLRADEGDSVTQTLHGAILHGAIKHFVAGKGAKGKHLHPRCWMLSNRLLESFLDGYLAGDGHYDQKNDRWRLTFCKNDAWAADLRTLAARLGRTLTLNASFATNGPKRFEAYRGELRSIRTGHHSERERAEIVAIDGTQGGEFIDVGVEDEPHLFALASGVLTHNSKPAPMPAPLSGWAWRRCRVNLGGHQSRGAVQRNVPGAHASPSTPTNSSWSDCPGCSKCEKHGGYVLRKGSWRPTSSWEPILMLAKTPDYFCDGESVKQPSAAATISRNEYSRIIDDPDEQFAVKHDHETTADGANLRDVWTIAAEPLKEKHYAAFPSELVLRCIRAGTSLKGYCPSCGKPWCRVIDGERYEPEVVEAGIRDVDESRNDKTRKLNGKSEEWKRAAVVKTLDWRPSCSCPPAPPRPGLVLDPFAGSGRTLLTARRLGLDAVGCELNPEYADMASRLLTEDSPLFNQVQT